MFSKILVVCVGNICRSPTGEELLRQLLPSKRVDSAGISTSISGLEGTSADGTAIKVADSFGLDISRHKAKQLTKSLCDEFDLILVMEPEHIDLVSIISPESRHKTLLFGQWSGGSISDPYQKTEDAFRATYKALFSSARTWAERLNP